MDEQILCHHSRLAIDSLPPTRRAIEAHTQRAFYTTSIQTSCMENKSLDPCDDG